MRRAPGPHGPAPFSGRIRTLNLRKKGFLCSSIPTIRWSSAGTPLPPGSFWGLGNTPLKLIQAAVQDAGAELITLAVRRANTRDQENILDYIPKGVTLLPNTSGARNAQEAVRIARLARELGCGDFVKIEIMRDSKYLLPRQRRDH